MTQAGAVADISTGSAVDPSLESKGRRDRARFSERRSLWPAAVCCGIYLVLALGEFGPFTSLGASHMTGSHTPDQIQQIWFLQWVYTALAHGHNPFFTEWQNYPVGMNLGANTSMAALGVLFSPITSSFGAIVTWNVLLRLALFLSASSMCLVLRRWTTWWPAAFVGGLLYGFSAYETFNAVGYLFLVFVPLPPLIFFLLYEILVRQQWRPIRTGALLGVACGVQYLISSEILVSTLIMGVLAVIIYSVACPRALVARWSYTRQAALSFFVVGGLLLAYPVFFGLLGPANIHGVAKLAGGQGDVLGPFVPGSEQWFSPTNTIWTQFEHYFYSAPMYVGLPFAGAIVATVVWLRRRRVVVLAGVLTAVGFILSMGTTLYVNGHDTGILMPFDLLAHVPLV